MRRRLPALQEDFQSYLLSLSGAMEQEIVSDTLDARMRLQIYADAYRLRLIEALETDFVALRAALGPEEFDRLGRAYIDANPSDHYSVRYFGRNLGRFLAQTDPYREQPVLADIARFEWAGRGCDSPCIPLSSVSIFNGTRAPSGMPPTRTRPCRRLSRPSTRLAG